MTQGYTEKVVMDDLSAGLVLELPAHSGLAQRSTMIIMVAFAAAVCGMLLLLGWKGLWDGDLQRGAGTISTALLFGTVALIPLRKSIWRLYGKAVVTLTPEGLTIWNKHLWFSGPQHFALGSIQNLRVGPPPEMDWIGRIYHPRYGPYARYGRIVFYANGRRVEFGEDIDAEEAAYLVRLLQVRLDAYKGTIPA